MTSTMPPAEVEVSVDLVTSLLTDQWPAYDGQPVTSLAHGWDNHLFKVGELYVARLPRRRAAVDLVANEARWVPGLAPYLALPVPVPRFVGHPGHGYPWRWTVIDWIEGESAALSAEMDLATCSSQLARFLSSLHRTAPEDAPANPFRGVPISTRDRIVRDRLATIEVDGVALSGVWAKALAAGEHRGPRVWIHGDLHPHNLLVADGRLTGVVDFGDIAAGDPATDLAIAWMLLPPTLHGDFRAGYGDADEDLWARSRGWALHLALAYLASSADNPIMERVGRSTVECLLEEASTARE